jgi:hypothetical protein
MVISTDEGISTKQRISLIDYTVQEARRFFLYFQFKIQKTIEFFCKYDTERDLLLSQLLLICFLANEAED